MRQAGGYSLLISIDHWFSNQKPLRNLLREKEVEGMRGRILPPIFFKKSNSTLIHFVYTAEHDLICRKGFMAQKFESHSVYMFSEVHSQYKSVTSLNWSLFASALIHFLCQSSNILIHFWPYHFSNFSDSHGPFPAYLLNLPLTGL